MKLVAITPYPPSQRPASSFAFEAIRGFLTSGHIEQVVVLADRISQPELESKNPALLIERCWSYNSILATLELLRAVRQHQPDVIWLNLQYTLFGSHPVPIFLGLLLTDWLNRLGYRVVTLLHNYLEAIEVSALGIKLHPLVRLGMPLADWLAMRAVMKADYLFVMEPAYKQVLQQRFPRSRIETVPHDLYPVPPYCPVPSDSKTLLTLGYYGTYKVLEPLLVVLEEIRYQLPDTQLAVVGKSHPQTPTYLEHLQASERTRRQGIQFLGYVADIHLPDLFWSARAVVVTNRGTTGSSAVLRFAALYGRAFIAPDLPYFQQMVAEGWGILLYEHGNRFSLQAALQHILTDLPFAVQLGHRNYQQVVHTANGFIHSHALAFVDLNKNSSTSKRPKI